MHLHDLELVDLIFGISELLENTRKLALICRRILCAADSLVQPWWTTHEDFDISALGIRDDFLEQVLCDESFAIWPAIRWLVESVESLEPLGKFVLDLLEFFLQQNVLLANVTEYQRDFGLVLWVGEDSSDKLIHGCDTGSSRDERDVVVLVWLPGVLGKGSFE
jgi:hypothetical protein